ncbi:unnamed protein product [Triticum turgidum subsp. durum]|uniref:Uncharacterized protein n=1 Tax=Triticum turgidum subsp. durum TaxID=4567 RepID=A0A9R0V6I1_TRITD|nr:unnamed protein product [Triticum turgidum subsp. durum]
MVTRLEGNNKQPIRMGRWGLTGSGFTWVSTSRKRRTCNVNPLSLLLSYRLFRYLSVLRNLLHPV